MDTGIQVNSNPSTGITHNASQQNYNFVTISEKSPPP